MNGYTECTEPAVKFPYIVNICTSLSAIKETNRSDKTALRCVFPSLSDFFFYSSQKPDLFGTVLALKDAL